MCSCVVRRLGTLDGRSSFLDDIRLLLGGAILFSVISEGINSGAEE